MVRIIVVDNKDNRRKNTLTRLKDKVRDYIGFKEICDLKSQYDPEHQEESCVYVLHVNNDGVWKHIDQKMSLKRNQYVFFSGGSYVNHMDKYYKKYGGFWWNGDNDDRDIKSPLYVDGVNENNVGNLVDAVFFICGNEGSKITPPKRYRLPHFEIRRRDLSHDHFKNGFCNALGFEAANNTGTSRYELFRRAAREHDTWLRMKSISIKWPMIGNSLRQIIEDADKETLFTHPRKKYVALREKAIVDIQKINELMLKFSGQCHCESVLTESEIEHFWCATDTIRTLLYSLRLDEVTGPDSNYFDDGKFINDSK